MSPGYERFRAQVSGLLANRKLLLKIAAGVSGVLMFILLVLFVWGMFFRTHEVHATATDRAWERQVEVEQYRVVEDRQWGGHPQDAYDVRSRREVHHYESYISHYRSVTTTYSCGTYQSPWTCTRTSQQPVYSSRPVYRIRYYFKVDRWVTDHWEKTSGSIEDPFWAEPTGMNPTDVLGNKRVGNERKEKYSFHISCGDCKSKRVELKYDDWRKLQNGSRVTAHVNSRGTIRGVSL